MAVAIVQARMGSTRLPGKVLRKLGPRPVLSWVVRAARASGIADVVVATSIGEDDDAIEKWCSEAGVDVVRGSQEDVLGRFLTVLEHHPHEVVVRLTGDCPLLDPVVIAETLACFDVRSLDYLSTVTPRTLPRGLDVEVVASEALRRADQIAATAEREHVTVAIIRRPHDFRVGGLTYSPPADDLRVTLDTPEDARLLDALVAALGDRPPAWRDVVRLLRARPDLVAINSHVRQKMLDEG